MPVPCYKGGKGLGRLACLALLLSLPISLSSCGPQEIIVDPGYGISGAEAPYEGVGYEIFTGSFSDGNGDGQGDLIGITQKVPYLELLGIRRIWLTPFYPSNSYHGYDVNDYYGVRAEYGTLQDFDVLVETCHEAGIEVIIDLVLNHSSNANPWFLQSAEDHRNGDTSEDSKADWYVWSENGGAGYTYSPVADAYYESNFSPSMPEFNCDNQDVREQFSDIVRFWLEDHKVDGFRFDAAIYFYYLNEQRNVEFLNWLKGVCRSIDPDCYLVAEAWLNSASALRPYEESGMTFFNFPMSELNGSGPGAGLSVASKLGYFPSSLCSTIEGIKEADPDGNLAMFVGNHDTDRLSGYFANSGEEQENKKKMLASMYILTPGTPWMYYGEEIDMWGVKGGANSDSPRRTAMVWGKGYPRARNPEGFDDSPYQTEKGAYDLLGEPYSLLNHYRKVIDLRNSFPSVFTMNAIWENLGNARAYPGFKITAQDGVYYLVHNTVSGEAEVALPIAASVVGEITTSRSSSILEGTSIAIPAFNSVLLKAV